MFTERHVRLGSPREFQAHTAFSAQRASTNLESQPSATVAKVFPATSTPGCGVTPPPLSWAELGSRIWGLCTWKGGACAPAPGSAVREAASGRGRRWALATAEAAGAG